MSNATTKVLFCGDRAVAADLVGHIRNNGGQIVGLGLNLPPFAEGAGALKAAAGVDTRMVFHGRNFASDVAVRRFGESAPDIGVCCGFAYVLPRHLLEVPRWGWVNIHRSYLPYNRGLDPLQWALAERTPAGVTLHVMTEAVDAGPIVAQAEFPILPTDNFQTLSDKADRVALELFGAQWPKLRAGVIEAIPQEHDLATYHSWADCQKLRRLDLNAVMPVGRLLDILRSYTGEAASGASFEVGPLRFSVHVQVKPQVDLASRPVTGSVATDTPAPGPAKPEVPPAVVPKQADGPSSPDPGPSPKANHSNNYTPLEVNR